MLEQTLRKIIPQRHIAPVLALGMMLVGCTCDPVLTIGNPVDRYDHNRTRSIMASADPSGAQKGVVVTQPVYAEKPRSPFQGVQYQGVAEAADGYPAAIVVPLFTGVPLPLSQEPADRGSSQSDYDDLIDFLAFPKDGGVPAEPDSSGMGGDPTEVLRRYAPMLDLLKRKSLDRAQIDEVAKRVGLTILLQSAIRDGRFIPGFFGEQVALRCGEFWFVLNRKPKTEWFSRLTLVPYRPPSQEQTRKDANSVMGVCQ